MTQLTMMEEEKPCDHNVVGEKREGWVQGKEPDEPDGYHHVKQNREVCLRCGDEPKGWTDVFVRKINGDDFTVEQRVELADNGELWI
jgi:hypothetical protein